MGVLSDLEPKNVFHFFEEISQIPHGSGNIERISGYLAEFARERGLACVQDELKNVIIVKEASAGYEGEPTVILQGHMDMVAVKKPDCDIDMKTEGLRLAVSGDKVYAEGTSLGGDDGIAVAYALAILDSDVIRHPRLEVILTVDEEVGMDGARGLDLSALTGSRMVNLDSEEEGIFLTSCAGGARVKCKIPMRTESAGGLACEVAIGGLLGGHSGAEIHKERGNSNCLFGRLLCRLCEEMPVRMAQVKGGLADNAIPRETVGVLLIEEKDRDKFGEVLRLAEQELREELSGKDPGVYVRAGEWRQEVRDSVTVEDTRRAAAFLMAVPNGVQAMSAELQGLVETSLNLGILELDAGKKEAAPCSGDPGQDAEQGGSAVLSAEFSVRSSVESAKHALIGKLRAVAGLAGGTYEVTGDYPGWRFRKDSPLRDKMIRLYEEMYGCKPKVEAIHAGLECGILGSKIPDLDCVSMGPDMRDIHTTEETLSISSTRRVWEYLVRLLETKDGKNG